MATQPTVSPTVAALDPLRWKALAVVLFASFMILLDVSIVNVAIPSIRTSIDTSFSQIEWVLAGYQLAYALTLITGGRLGDIYGRKRLFMLGVAGFTLASAACGFAQSGAFLITARVIQGFMAALMYPQVFAVIQVNFPPRERGKAFGLAGAVIGVASIAGPLAGGLLIQANILGLQWRPIFLVNVPIGIGAVVAAKFFLHESTAPSKPRLDIPGVIIATIALFLLAYPLVEGRDAGWPLWTFGMLAAAVVTFVVFAIYNNHRAKTTGSPLVEPALFTDRAFVVGLLVTGVFISGIPAFFLTFSIFLQVGHGFSALATGLTTVPFAVASAFASGMSIRLAPKIGKRILLVGAALLDIGMLGLLLSLHLIGDGTFHGYYLIPALAVSGLGLGCVIAPLINIILAGIHHGNAGSASGVVTTVQQIGGALGVTIIGVIFFGLITTHAPDVSAARTPALTHALTQAGIPATAVGGVTDQVSACFNDTAASSDPNVSPPSCVALQNQADAFRQAGSAAAAQVGAVIQAEFPTRLADDFTFSFERSLIYNLAAWTLTFLLVFLLPSTKPGDRPNSAATAH